MVDVKITSVRTLDTPADIAQFLTERHAAAVDGAVFQYGDLVKLTKRDGLPPEMCQGDVATYLYSEPAPSPFTSVRMLLANGSLITTNVQTANLAKWEGAAS